MIYIEGDGFHAYYKKEYIHDLVKGNPDCIRVDQYPYPFLLPALSSRYKKYDRSEPSDTENDNLLRLPRE